MEMINSKSLFYTAHHLLKHVDLLKSAENSTVIRETIQHITIDSKKFTLMFLAKPCDSNSTPELPTTQMVDQEFLIDAAQELVSAVPKPTGHEFFKKDIQQFSGMDGNKFILSLTFSASEEPIV